MSASSVTSCFCCQLCCFCSSRLPSRLFNLMKCIWHANSYLTRLKDLKSSGCKLEAVIGIAQQILDFWGQYQYLRITKIYQPIFIVLHKQALLSLQDMCRTFDSWNNKLVSALWQKNYITETQFLITFIISVKNVSINQQTQCGSDICTRALLMCM